MFFQSWSEFWAMGGYGFYVWLSYGISLLTIVILIAQSVRGKKKVFESVRREQQREQRLARGQS
ncbi:heme exporter protein CcmD [Haemophilus paracuniculus]|uniref:Heme exporter protein D n=1 Tax=Haemophilus paracuniculus TaxID=734 RepID=A0A1T0AVB2_9PAST|nr:heme exporter protein CcmD [Haemophilus paracuniculus]OOS00223.1 heme exporter protein CcmD [Haemophilus paracuniculus]